MSTVLFVIYFIIAAALWIFTGWIIRMIKGWRIYKANPETLSTAINASRYGHMQYDWTLRELAEQCKHPLSFREFAVVCYRANRANRAFSRYFRP